MVSDGTLTGVGVVMAQRLEQLAEPGEVVVQSTVAETVPSRLPFDFHDLGAFALKGIEKKVSAFRAEMKDGDAAVESDNPRLVEGVNFPPDEGNPQSGSGDRRATIAILPFENFSRDSEMAEFAEGILEELYITLSHISELQVVSKSVMAQYQGQATNAIQLGHDLSADFVLEGSVRRGGNKVRASLKLIDTDSGYQIWADRYDLSMEDVLAEQESIAESVGLELQVRTTRGENIRVMAGGTFSPEAYQCVVTGSNFVEKYIKEDMLEARRLAQRAIDIDPSYAHAHILLSWAYWGNAAFPWGENSNEALEKAVTEVQLALDLDRDNPNALSALGCFHVALGNHDRALKLTNHAIEIAPTDTESMSISAYVVTMCGEYETGIQRMKRAMKLSQICPAWYMSTLTVAHYLLGEFEAAVSSGREAIALEPMSVAPKMVLIPPLAEMGFKEEARGIAGETRHLESAISVQRFVDRYLNYKDPAIKGRIRDRLIEAGLDH